jgi:hypothetical protein
LEPEPILRVHLLLIPKREVIVTRPLRELWSHIVNFTCPRFELIWRAIKVLVLSIFRWHFCDQVLLHDKGFFLPNIHHSLQGQVTVEDADTINQTHPYLLENGIRLKLRSWVELMEASFCERNPSEVDAQYIRDYLLDRHAIDLTGKPSGSTIYDLLHSPLLEEVALEPEPGVAARVPDAPEEVGVVPDANT